MLRAVLEAEKAPPVLLPLYFRLRLAGALGFAPNLGQCGRCGRTISEDALFVVDEGQLRCSSCRSSRFELERYGVEIPAQGLDLLRHVQQSFPSGWPDGELPPPVRRACARAMDRFCPVPSGAGLGRKLFSSGLSLPVPSAGQKTNEGDASDWRRRS